MAQSLALYGFAGICITLVFLLFQKKEEREGQKLEEKKEEREEQKREEKKEEREEQKREEKKEEREEQKRKGGSVPAHWGSCFSSHVYPHCQDEAAGV